MGKAYRKLQAEQAGGGQVRPPASDGEYAVQGLSMREAQRSVDNYIATETVTRRWASIPPFIAALVVPPLVVLILGWLVGWAISGFRRTA